MIDVPMIARIVAPNLTAATRRYDDAQLAAMIRHGVRPDGRSMIVMPSEAFVALDDGDLGRIIAFLRTLPAVAGPGASVALRPLGRVGLAAGQFKLAARLIADSAQPPRRPARWRFAAGISRKPCVQVVTVPTCEAIPIRISSVRTWA